MINQWIILGYLMFKPIQPEANQASVEELLAKQEEAKKAEEAGGTHRNADGYV